MERRLEGLLDEPRPGIPRKVGEREVERVLSFTLEHAPADTTHWNTRAMAGAVGSARVRGGRIWRAFGLQAHRVEGFKLSKGPPRSSKRCATSWLFFHQLEAPLRGGFDEGHFFVRKHAYC